MKKKANFAHPRIHIIPAKRGLEIYRCLVTESPRQVSVLAMGGLSFITHTI